MLALTKFPGKQEGSLGEGWKGVKERVPKKQLLLFLGLASLSYSFTSSLCLSVAGSCSSSQTSQVLSQTCGWELLAPHTRDGDLRCRCPYPKHLRHCQNLVP